MEVDVHLIRASVDGQVFAGFSEWFSAFTIHSVMDFSSEQKVDGLSRMDGERQQKPSLADCWLFRADAVILLEPSSAPFMSAVPQQQQVHATWFLLINHTCRMIWLGSKVQQSNGQAPALSLALYFIQPQP